MVTKAAKTIFSAYPKDSYADPEGFAVQLAMVLEAYSDDVIKSASSPLTGIQRTSKYAPRISEIVDFCDAENERLGRLRAANQYKFEPRILEPVAHRANVFVPPHAPQHSRMMRMAENADPINFRYENGGVWVPLQWLDGSERTPGFRKFSQSDISEECSTEPRS